VKEQRTLRRENGVKGTMETEPLPADVDPDEAETAHDQYVALSVDKDVFRDVIGHFATGVTIITARADEVDYGLTVSAVTSLSLEPPMMIVCVNKTSRTLPAIRASGTFGVNILGEGQGELAQRFATNRDDKFDGVRVVYSELGNPLLEDALAHLECQIIQEVTGGTHSVFLAVVQRAERFEGAPLAYFRGRFGRLELNEEPMSDKEVRSLLSEHFYNAVFLTHP
jgi:flavin reductase (DIM6/NTAB) family NADH-FMN oxidoreductase RutF